MENITLSNEQIEQLDFYLTLDLKKGYGYYEISRDYITIGLANGILLKASAISKVIEITGAEVVYVQNNEIIFVLTLEGAALRARNNRKSEPVIHVSSDTIKSHKWVPEDYVSPDKRII